MISNRVRETHVPPLVELGQFVSQQKNCISLGQGAPFYNPPKNVFLPLIEELGHHTVHRYTHDPGLPQLRQALATKLLEDQKISVVPDELVITPGANQAFYNVLLTLTDPGDEIILLTPYYFNHHMACTSLGVIPVVVPLDPDFTMNGQKIRNVISPKTKAIVVVNPGNPTGKVHTGDELRQIIELIDEFDLLVIADETYEYFVYEGSHIPLATLTDRVISIGSFSKTFGVPGWRLGYYAADQQIIGESLKVQDTIGICAPHSSQYLGISLLQQRKTLIPQFVGLMRRNYRLATDLISEISWLEIEKSGGAYYLFPRQITGKNTEQLVRELIVDHGVYIVPGVGFGSDWNDHCRLSFANVTEEQLKDAFSRLRGYS